MRVSPRVRRHFSIVWCLAGALVLAASSRSAVNLCGVDCICISWPVTGGEWLEVRCADGTGNWVTDAPPPGTRPPDGGGSFGGNGNQQSPPTNLPGDPIKPEHLTKFSLAKSAARSKLKRKRIPDFDPPTLAPTTCTEMFENSPLGMTGIDLLLNYAIFRDGQDVADASGVKPCKVSSARAAWTTCCSHDPVVYLCDGFYSLGSSSAAIVLIHELLHVAGQLEDGTTTTGPGNPPTTNQIQSTVTQACTNPEVVY